MRQALLALALTGCIVSVEFDPVGEAASAQGAWTVRGAPPTVESCGEMRYVRVRFFRGEDYRDHPDLVFDCAAGGFDTRPARVVGEGVWTVAALGVREDGTVVERGPDNVWDTAASGGHLVLEPVDFMGGP